MSKHMRAIGLMSGTSMDGIDVAMIDTDGETDVTRGPSMTFPYPAEMRAKLAEALAHARHIKARRDRPGMLTTTERELTEYHSSAVSAFLRKQRIDRTTVDVIGFHGHTVLHKPEDRLTVQIGDGRHLAEYCRVPVVCDLRAADMEAGGQGAPLVPVYHRALVASMPQRPVVVVNIGGVANVTWIGADGALMAFDTGPGNALIDDWVKKHTGRTCDEGGAIAASGTPNEEVIGFYLAHEFFATPPPKSLDRNAFFSELVDWMSIEDGAATLTGFTAEALARAVSHLPAEPELWVICGGGRLNPALMQQIESRVCGRVVPAEDVGLDGGSVEAEAWAYMAVRSLRGLPITFPGSTGVSQPTSGGIYFEPPPLEEVLRAQDHE